MTSTLQPGVAPPVRSDFTDDEAGAATSKPPGSGAAPGGGGSHPAAGLGSPMAISFIAIGALALLAAATLGRVLWRRRGVV